MLFWKLEQWIERQFGHFVRSIQQHMNAQIEQTVFLQNIFLCFFKNIDSFFMCLIVFVLADFFAQRS